MPQIETVMFVPSDQLRHVNILIQFLDQIYYNTNKITFRATTR